MKTRNILFAALVAVCLSACIMKSYNSNQQGQTISGPSTEASPPTTCTLTALDLGSEHDTNTLHQGGDAVKLVPSVFGLQHLEILEGNSCRAAIQLSYPATVAPCVLEGGGFSTFVRAPLAAPLGASCTVTASSGGFSASKLFTVVAP